MAKITLNCPICSKELREPHSVKLGSAQMIAYKCGHVFARDLLTIDRAGLDFTSVDGSGKVARDYQKDGIQFILETEFNAILADQMRLGKTPQALLALKNAYKERTPCLIAVRSANLWQWIREYKVWTDSLINGIFPIIGSESWIPPGFSAYIISMDTLGAQAKCMCGHRFHENTCKAKNCDCKIYRSNGQGILDRLKKIPFKLIIADEAHSFKNGDSNRSQALVNLVEHLNTGEKTLDIAFDCTRCGHKWIEQGKVAFDKRIGHKVTSKQSRCPECQTYCYVQQQHAEKIKDPAERPCGLILLSGTPIKNRADEYFVPLNLVAPQHITSLRRYQNDWLEQNEKGAYARVKRYRLEEFKEFIKPYVLRREKEDVYTDLPKLSRTFTLIEPDKELYAKEYNRILDKMEGQLADKANPTYWDMKEDMMELRRICGMMKTLWAADYLDACLLDSDSQRYAVGIHHKSVRDILYLKLGRDANCLKLSGEDSAERKDWVMRNFETSAQRLLIINMLAGGVGMDFHYCNNCLILERQWSSADEEQFEFRFYNPDMSIKTAPTAIEYVVAKGTIDEFFFDLVEDKRRIFGETISNHWTLDQDNGSFRGLVERTLSGRL